MITMSEAATTKIRNMADEHDAPENGIRVMVVGGGCSGLTYDMDFEHETKEGDQVFESDGVKIYIDPMSYVYLKGTRVDYVETFSFSGFHFENPNPIWLDDIASRVQEIIDTEVNPAVASHGGNVSLVDVKDGEAIIAFGGGCQGCSAVDVTLKHGVETMIKENVPEITIITDATDHAAGANPFY